MDWTRAAWTLAGGALAVGCQVRGVVGSNVDAGQVSGGGTVGDDGGSGIGPSTGQDGGDGGVTSNGVTVTDSAPIFDVGPPDAGAFCAAPLPASCEDGDPFHALGLGCPDDDVPFEGTVMGSANAVLVHQGQLGTTDTFAPRGGNEVVILSTGMAWQIPMTHSDAGCPDPKFCPSTSNAEPERLALPSPIQVRKVHPTRTCADDPTLVGTGDCSNTLEDEWNAILDAGPDVPRAYDYVEMRLKMTVPPFTDGLQYDFAFMTSEYPEFWAPGHTSFYNDMYVAWLESEGWTGNISFDESGNPISINSVWLEHQDGPNDACPTCDAPALKGFAMEGHAATGWLTTTAPVRAGEEVEIVFGLFDLTDSLFDSAVLLDNFFWTCSGAPPVTQPAG